MVLEEHGDMVRGLMIRLGREKDLLEWRVEDGWGPLCKFLGKEVPSEPFPTANDRDAFKKREEQVTKMVMARVARKLVIACSIFVAIILVVWKVM